MRTQEDVLAYVKEQNVQFINLTFVDIFGKKKDITIMQGELKRAFSNGIALDASAIEGFQLDAKIDLVVKPDPDTVSEMPAVLVDPAEGRILHMFADVYYPDGRIFENDTRALLKKAVQDAADAGFRFNFGPAMEFYLLKRENREPVDDAGYMASAPEDRCEMIRREICRNLLQMGIRPEVAYHEEGPGQNKIKFHFSDPLKAADSVVAYKAVVRSVARAHDLAADFSPKPIDKEPGNSLHVNLSVVAEDEHDRTPHIISGILAHISEMTLFLNPAKKSYKRLGHDRAPRYISWSEANRSTLIRIPAYSTGGIPRFELRSPDNLANPYLAFALLIYACMDGIRNKPTLPRATEEDLFLEAKPSQKLKSLPLTFTEAVNAAKSSAFIKKYLSPRLAELYMKESKD